MYFWFIFNLCGFTRNNIRITIVTYIDICVRHIMQTTCALICDSALIQCHGSGTFLISSIAICCVLFYLSLTVYNSTYNNRRL